MRSTVHANTRRKRLSCWRTRLQQTLRTELVLTVHKTLLQGICLVWPYQRESFATVVPTLSWERFSKAGLKITLKYRKHSPRDCAQCFSTFIVIEWMSTAISIKNMGDVNHPDSLTRRVTSYQKVKILVLGDSGVGKTAFVRSVCHGATQRNPPWTVGCRTEVLLYESTVLRKAAFIEFWDVSGHPKYEQSRHVFYRELNGVLLAFDLSNRRSYANLSKWMRELAMWDRATEAGIEEAHGSRFLARHKTQSSLNSLPILVVGLKLDKAALEKDRAHCPSLKDYGIDSIQVSSFDVAQTWEGLHSFFEAVLHRRFLDASSAATPTSSPLLDRSLHRSVDCTSQPSQIHEPQAFPHQLPEKEPPGAHQQHQPPLQGMSGAAWPSYAHRRQAHNTSPSQAQRSRSGIVFGNARYSVDLQPSSSSTPSSSPSFIPSSFHPAQHSASSSYHLPSSSHPTTDTDEKGNRFDLKGHQLASSPAGWPARPSTLLRRPVAFSSGNTANLPLDPEYLAGRIDSPDNHVPAAGRVDQQHAEQAGHGQTGRNILSLRLDLEGPIVFHT
eukprot:g60670.t1